MPTSSFETTLGRCAISWEDDEITGFHLPPVEVSREHSESIPAWVLPIVAGVCRHLEGIPQDFSDLPYAWHRVSEFQRSVFQAALGVKSGQTWSYGQLTTKIGHPLSAARAVGTALGHNPWPLLVPCHRFVGADGRMTGFSSPGGIQTKLRLLALEGAELFAV